MSFKYKSTYSIDNRKDGFKTVLFVSDEGRHFYPALISKLLSDDAADKIRDVIKEDINGAIF